MKKQFLFVLALCAAPFFSSCETEVEGDDSRIVVDFEDAELDANGICNNASFIFDNSVVFVNNYNADWDSWAGFAISNHVDSQTIGYINMYSVYSGGGLRDSEKYAVCYYSPYDGESMITYSPKNNDGGLLMRPEKVYISLTTYTYLSAHDGKDGYYDAAAMFVDGDWMDVIFNGYQGERMTGSLTKRVIDKSTDLFLTSWTQVDLTPLGAVDRIGISIDSNKKDDYGLIVPTYIALDDFMFSRGE